MADQIAGWETPIHQSLTAPQLVAGVPRTFFVLFFGASVAIGVHWPPAFLVSGIVYGLAWVCTRHDTDFLTILCRHLAYKPHYDA